MPAGRPSLYKAEYCEQVIELGKEGKSPAQIASKLEVDRQTLANWGEKHPEFFAAITRAKVEEQNWWEQKAQENLGNREFNAPVWKTSMQARFRDDYTERREHTGAEGKPLVPENSSDTNALAAAMATLIANGQKPDGESG